MKKICLLLISIIIFFYPCQSFAHEHDNIVYNFENYVVDGVLLPKFNVDEIIAYMEREIIEAYSEYYTIPDITSKIKRVEINQGKLIFYFNAHIKKMLKVSSAYELPYIEGLNQQLQNCKQKDGYKSLEAELNSRVYEIEREYIGKIQEENAEFRIMMLYSDFQNLSSLKNMENFKILDIVFMDEYDSALTMEEFKPESREKLKQAGLEAAQSIILSAAHESISFKHAKTKRTNSSSPTDYDRVAARDYIRAWTDNCVSCHCFSCDPNKSVYNPQYSNYHDTDCANYVSQAIHAGGISTDNVWSPGRTTWTWLNDLCDYMVNEGFFFRTNSKNKAIAGSIVRWNDRAHIAMVDQNDTVTMTLCSHTNDRYQMSFKYTNNKYFYVPVWDSYTNQWTPQN